MIYTEIESPIDGSKVIKRDNEDGSLSFIPKDPANSDYQRYLAWLENPEAEHLNGSDN
jgi:hypothetical protein